jgi:hypothetical protein
MPGLFFERRLWSDTASITAVEVGAALQVRRLHGEHSTA